MGRLFGVLLVASFIQSALMDEFSTPTHTPTVQLLYPSKESCTPSDLDVIFAAPQNSEVIISIDGIEAARLNGSHGHGHILGISNGKHV
jgi:hypothetical protein